MLQTVAGVGFKEELGTAPTGSAISPVLAAVQDADRWACGRVRDAACACCGPVLAACGPTVHARWLWLV